MCVVVCDVTCCSSPAHPSHVEPKYELALQSHDIHVEPTYAMAAQTHDSDAEEDATASLT